MAIFFFFHTWSCDAACKRILLSYSVKGLLLLGDCQTPVSCKDKKQEFMITLSGLLIYILLIFFPLWLFQLTKLTFNLFESSFVLLDCENYRSVRISLCLAS